MCSLSVCSGSGSEGGGDPVSAMSLPEFLAEAELSHYHTALRNELKVTCVEHLKVSRLMVGRGGGGLSVVRKVQN